jgi:hypothetical protein
VKVALGWVVRVAVVGALATVGAIGVRDSGLGPALWMGLFGHEASAAVVDKVRRELNVAFTSETEYRLTFLVRDEGEEHLIDYVCDEDYFSRARMAEDRGLAQLYPTVPVEYTTLAGGFIVPRGQQAVAPVEALTALAIFAFALGVAALFAHDARKDWAEYRKRR